ncbi:MAG: hypothetical protein ACMXYK_00260 [Candidatus Woesearchaeota archaeon]
MTRIEMPILGYSQEILQRRLRQYNIPFLMLREEDFDCYEISAEPKDIARHVIEAGGKSPIITYDFYVLRLFGSHVRDFLDERNIPCKVRDAPEKERFGEVIFSYKTKPEIQRDLEESLDQVCLDVSLG